MTKAQELKFASLGEERQIGSWVKLADLDKASLNNFHGYISGWDEGQQFHKTCKKRAKEELKKLQKQTASA